MLKTGRKEALYHDDPAVASQVEAEQEKVLQEKTERANNRVAASRGELEVMQEQLGQLKQLVEQQVQAAKGNETAQGQAQQQTRSDNYRGSGRYNSNNSNNYRENGYSGQQRGYYNNNGGYRGRGNYSGRGSYNGEWRLLQPYATPTYAEQWRTIDDSTGTKHKPAERTGHSAIQKTCGSRIDANNCQLLSGQHI